MKPINPYNEIYSVGNAVKTNPLMPKFVTDYYIQIDKAVVEGNDNISFRIVEAAKCDYLSKGILFKPEGFVFSEQDANEIINDLYSVKENYIEKKEFENEYIPQEEYDSIYAQLEKTAEEIMNFVGKPIYVLYTQAVSTAEIKLATPKLPIL